MSNLLTTAAQAVEARDHTTAMAVGPPVDWEIELEPDEHGKVAIMTRPDGMIRVELSESGNGYEVRLAGRITDTPDASWLSKQEERASHLLEGYGRMSFLARRSEDENPPQLVSYEHNPPIVSDEVTESQYTYEWGMKKYQVTVQHS